MDKQNLTYSSLKDSIQNLLNSEEISFIMHQNPSQSTSSVLQKKINNQQNFKSFAQILGFEYARKLSELIRCPVETSLSFADRTDFRSDDMLFQTQNLLCRLSETDAQKLIALVLKCKNPVYQTKIKGISLKILNQCLEPISKILHQNTPQLFPQNKLTPLLPADVTDFAKTDILLHLDIKGQLIKIYLNIATQTLNSILHPDIIEQDVANNKNCLTQSLENKKLRLYAQTAPVRLPLAQILKWQKGSFIPLGLKPDEEIILNTQGIKPLKAVIGQKNTHIAVKLTTEVKKNDKL